MRIGIDVKLLRSNTAGLRVYLEGLLDALQDLDHQNEYVLFSPSSVSYKLTAPNFSYAVSKTKLPGILWQQLKLPKLAKEHQIDVFWGPEQTIFLKRPRGMGKVLTVHDFVYKRYPKTMQGSVRAITAYYGSRSLSHSDRIVCVSHFTARELRHFFPRISEDKIRVIGNGIKSDSPQPQIEKGNFFFFTGSLEPRKNLKNLIRAMEILSQEGFSPNLRIAGPAGWKNKAFLRNLEKSPVRDSIEILGFVSKEKLRELYSTCRAFVYPSLYEGFGLPALEALQCQARVVTSKNSPMQEFLGGLGTYCDPTSPEDIANAIRPYLENPSLAEYDDKERQATKKILERCSWKNAARTLLNVFEELRAEKTR